jgi:hypothetical protein
MSDLDKVQVTFEIYPEHFEMLKEIAAKYELPDPSKALRCLLAYAATDGDWDTIFKEVRCLHCG